MPIWSTPRAPYPIGRSDLHPRHQARVAPTSKNRCSFHEGPDMKKSKSPNLFTRITTYAELAQHSRGFAGGHLGFLILTGSAGVGKSTAFRNCLGDSAHWIEG